MTTYQGSHVLVDKRRRKQLLVIFAVAIAMVTVGLWSAIADADSPGSTCTGTAPDENGHVQLECVIPAALPSVITVTSPVLVPTTITETTTVTETKTVTSAPTSTAPTTTPPTTAPPTQTPPPPSSGWPTASTTGVPAGWSPTSTRNSWRITTPGVYEDVRVNGRITVTTGGVTLRRVEVVGGDVVNQACGSAAPLVLENVTFRPRDGQARAGTAEGAVHHGNFVFRNSKIVDYIEGLRAGDCGPISVENSYITVDDGNDCRLHADGIQGYGGRGVKIRNTVIDAREMGCGTAPFFYPRGNHQGNQGSSVDIDGLWLAGGGYSFRLGLPATVKNVQILDRSWGYGPVDVYCPAIIAWDVKIVDRAGNALRNVSCGGSGT